MRRTTMVWPVHCLTIAMVIVLGMWGCDNNSSIVTPWPAGLGASMPECPRFGEWKKFFSDKRFISIFSASGELSVPRHITDVPEFHDCQKLIVMKASGAAPAYLGLFAIFARDSLRHYAVRFDSVKPKDSLLTHTDTSLVNSAGHALAVGEILALDSGYATLGIKPGFNCLLLYGQVGAGSGLAAKMVPVGGNEKQCATDMNPVEVAGTQLEVHRNPFPPDAVPPVARWDWDSTHAQVHMGIACGSAWCDVGAPSFVSAVAYAGSITAAGDAIYAVKGWYDEQRLAFPATTSGTGGPTPLSVGTMGTFLPMPDLGNDSGAPDTSRYAHRWVPVATAAVAAGNNVYFKKLNLQASVVRPSRDSIYLCYGDRPSCLPPFPPLKAPHCKATGEPEIWWAKIVARPEPAAMVAGGAPMGATTHYFCVQRREHTNVHIPGVVRWRWAVNDETMWIRCLEGCCEVEAGSKDTMS